MRYLDFFLAKFQRQIQELLVSPMSAVTLCSGIYWERRDQRFNGWCLSEPRRFVFYSLAFFTFFIFDYCVITISCSCLFALAGLINAIYANNFDDITIVPTFVLTPLTYLGGVFYSINLLPKFWQYISLVNPITYIVNAFRYGFLGVADASVAMAFIVTTVFCLYFIYFCILFNQFKGMRIRE